MNPHHRALRATLAATVGALALVPPAAAVTVAPPKQPASSSVMRDCTEHFGVVTQRHSRTALINAYRALPDTEKLFDCGQGIASALALKRTRGTAGQVIDDCLNHGGRLTRAYSPAALLRARRRATREQLAETRCLIGISTQQRQQGSRIRLGLPTRRITTTGPLDQRPGEQVADTLAPVFAPFITAAAGPDTLPDRVRGFLEFLNEQEGRDNVIDRARRAGPLQAKIWAFPARGSFCAVRAVLTATTSVCNNAAAALAGTPNLAVTGGPRGSFDIWGTAPDTLPALTVITTPGHKTTRPTTNHGLLINVATLPVTISWTLPDGTTHYFDASRQYCTRNHKPCVRVPDPTR